MIKKSYKKNRQVKDKGNNIIKERSIKERCFVCGKLRIVQKACEV